MQPTPTSAAGQAAPRLAATAPGPADDREPVIVVRDLRKSYGDLKAVDGIGFEVGRGEIFGLLGPNGAGKTTTVEILEGHRRLDGGEARVLGFDVARGSPPKERFGVQLQSGALFPRLTVLEVVELFRSFYPRSLPATELIDALDLGERRDARVNQLSGGQQQRLAVALALVNDPELLFLDEPTTGLDPQARRSLWTLIAGLRDRGKSVLLTTHYMEEAEALCDRVAIMDHGHILEMGSVTDLVNRRFKTRAIRFDAIPELDGERLRALPGVEHGVDEDGETVLYSTDVPATIGGLLDATAAIGREAKNLAVRPASLEDVFLDLTGRALRD